MRISNGILVAVLVMTWGPVFCGANAASVQNDPIDMQKAREALYLVQDRQPASRIVLSPAPTKLEAFAAGELRA